jgi:hypothetical protein
MILLKGKDWLKNKDKIQLTFGALIVKKVKKANNTIS